MPTMIFREEHLRESLAHAHDEAASPADEREGAEQPAI